MYGLPIFSSKWSKITDIAVAKCEGMMTIFVNKAYAVTATAKLIKLVLLSTIINYYMLFLMHY